MLPRVGEGKAVMNGSNHNAPYPSTLRVGQTQRLGKTSKPLAASERLTISVTRPGKIFFCASRNLRP